MNTITPPVFVLCVPLALVLTACGGSSGGGGGTTPGADGGTTTVPSDKDSGTTSAPSDDATTTTPDEDGGTTPSSDTSPSPSCTGDFTLGKHFVTTGSTASIGETCNGSIPTNCMDGWFIRAGGSCVCIASCRSFGVSKGENCSKSGAWVCQEVQATNASANSGTVCVKKEWNICTK